MGGPDAWYYVELAFLDERGPKIPFLKEISDDAELLRNKIQVLLDAQDDLDSLEEREAEKARELDKLLNYVESGGRKRSTAIHCDPRSRSGSVGRKRLMSIRNQSWRLPSRCGRRLPHHRRLPVLERLLEEIREANRHHEL